MHIKYKRRRNRQSVIRTGFLPGKAALRLFVAEVYTHNIRRYTILLLCIRYYNIIIINIPCTEKVI